ncbi:MAG: MBL fold metallo-hydrolase [Bacteroidales bacterium]
MEVEPLILQDKMTFEIVRIINEPISSNCYLLFNKNLNNHCIIVDPGSENAEIITSEIEKFKLVPQYIILTHEHFDHCWSCNDLIKQYNIPIICSENCREAIQSSRKNCSLYYNQTGFEIEAQTMSIESIEKRLFWNHCEFNFLLTQGHSNASICFLVGNCLFTGDTLIQNEKTVTKLLSGSKEKLKQSIQLINQFQGKGYTVYAGHGDQFELDQYNTKLVF